MTAHESFGPVHLYVGNQLAAIMYHRNLQSLNPTGCEYMATVAPALLLIILTAFEQNISLRKEGDV